MIMHYWYLLLSLAPVVYDINTIIIIVINTGKRNSFQSTTERSASTVILTVQHTKRQTWTKTNHNNYNTTNCVFVVANCVIANC